jgi:hypothetical protein
MAFHIRLATGFLSSAALFIVESRFFEDFWIHA